MLKSVKRSSLRHFVWMMKYDELMWNTDEHEVKGQQRLLVLKTGGDAGDVNVSQGLKIDKCWEPRHQFTYKTSLSCCV